MKKRVALARAIVTDHRNNLEQVPMPFAFYPTLSIV